LLHLLLGQPMTDNFVLDVDDAHLLGQGCVDQLNSFNSSNDGTGDRHLSQS